MKKFQLFSALVLALGAAVLVGCGGSGSPYAQDNSNGGGTPPPVGQVSLTLTPESASASEGGSAQYTITAKLIEETAALTRADDHKVQLSVTGLPAEVTSSFSANPITATEAGATSVLTVNVPSENEETLQKPRATPAGTYNFTIVARVDGRTINLPASLTVENESNTDFTITGPETVISFPGGSEFYQGTLGLMEGTEGSGPVTISVSGLPNGVTATIEPNPVTVEGGSSPFDILFTVGQNVPTGEYPITITGNNGSKTHSYTATLSVRIPV